MEKSRRHASSASEPYALSSHHAAVDGDPFPVRLPGIARGSEGRDLHDLAPHPHVDEEETAAYQPGVAQATADLFGRRIGRHVEVLRLSPEQQIPYPAAHEIGLVPTAAKATENLEGRLADAAREMLCSGRS